MTIHWDAKYATGQTQVDAQHQKLFEYLASFEELRKNYDAAKAAALMCFLDNYIQQHFTFEEICMHRLKCPAAEENKTAHKKFSEAYATFKQRYIESNSDPRVFADLGVMIESWITTHIMRVDSKLKPCLRNGAV